MGQLTHGLQTEVAAIISPATLVYANPKVFSKLISSPMSLHARAAINLILLPTPATTSPSSRKSSPKKINILVYSRIYAGRAQQKPVLDLGEGAISFFLHHWINSAFTTEPQTQ